MSVIHMNRGRTQVLAREIVARAKPFFTVRQGHVCEAIACALGFRSDAALRSSRVDSTQPRFHKFNWTAFTERLSDLHGNERTAYAVATLAEGTTLDIEIKKHPPEKYSRYTHVQYEITATLSDYFGTSFRRELDFHLPTFFSRGVEPYRVDSWWSHRSDLGDYAVTRHSSGRGLLTGKFIDGVWKGELYVYSSTHQQDDRSCLQSVRAALARSILPAATSVVCCDIWRPDRYDNGAWRVELRLGDSIARQVAGTELFFDIPDAKHRLFICAEGYGHPLTRGRFIGGLWLADLYSNSVPESENPTSISAVRSLLLKSVHESLSRAGIDSSDDCSLLREKLIDS